MPLLLRLKRAKLPCCGRANYCYYNFMQSEMPILACGSMNFGPGVGALILSILGLWLIGFILYLFNIAWILMDSDVRFRSIHGAIFLAYTFLAIGAYTGGFGYASVLGAAAIQVIGILVILIPILVIGHFIFMVFGRRKRRNRQQTIESLPSSQPPCELPKPPSIGSGGTADEKLQPFVKKPGDTGNA
jgi:hypothetical protein